MYWSGQFALFPVRALPISLLELNRSKCNLQQEGASVYPDPPTAQNAIHVIDQCPDT
jgi:hypothetical protein